MDASGSCTLEGCTAGEGGPCAEGHEGLTDCPNFTSDVAPMSDDGGDSTVFIGSAGHLVTEDTADITRSSLARVVVLAGPAKSGKTTLLTSIYECFQEGPFAAMLFAGSNTLQGLERRCHLSRTASKREEADTERTKHTYENHYLHLKVRPEIGASLLDVLLTDLHGERFRLARDSEDECRKLTVTRRADHIAVLVDGERLADLRTRTRTFQETRSLIRSLIDSDMVGRRTRIQIVFSKWDVVKQHAELKAIAEFVRRAEETARTEFELRLGGLEIFKIAARPVGTALPFAFGLADLFKNWVNTSSIIATPHPDVNALRALSFSSEFERFLGRALGQ